MSGVVVVLWLGTAASRPSADPELDSWARARLVRLEDALEAPAATAEYDEELVRKIEELLDEARVKSDAMDEAGALARLTDASQLIEGHPELPQAAWLSAERMTLEAILLERHPDGSERARALRRATRALEGKRIATLAEAGKVTFDDSGPAEAGARVVIQGLQPGDRLFWDGRPAPHAVPADAELHHARVVRQGRTVWAGWTAAEAGSRLTLGAPTPVTCSLDDLGAASIKDQRVIAPAGARCPSWAVARPQAGGGIEIASCAKNRCGPLLPWRKGDGAEFGAPPQPAPERHTPVWLFVAAGIGAAALTSIFVWQSGAFDDPEPVRDRVIFTGPARR